MELLPCGRPRQGLELGRRQQARPRVPYPLCASAYWASIFLDPGTRITYSPRRFTSTAQTRDFVAATPAAWSYTDLIEARGVHAASYQGVAW